MIEGRFWWEQTPDYWDMPFFSEFGLSTLPERDDALAVREQLWAMRELEDEGDLGAMWPELENKTIQEPDL